MKSSGSRGAAAATVLLVGAALSAAAIAQPGAPEVVVAAPATLLFDRADRSDALFDNAPARVPPVGVAGVITAASTFEPAIRERGFFEDGDAPRGYRVELAAGETMRITLSAIPFAGALFALDLFDGDGTGRHLAGIDAAGTGSAAELRWVAERDAAVVAILAPVTAGAYTLSVERDAALVWPVARTGAEALIGHYLDPRDDGARVHRGVDIHAPHGTPVLAAADGVIHRVGESELGGLVIWLDELRTGRRHYYAHLDAIVVTEGQRIYAGTPIGTVGTTGNAEDTAPHLHFGVYAGASSIDPARLLLGARLDEGDVTVPVISSSSRPRSR